MSRSEFDGAGEETTHETTYTGVPTAPWASLPFLDKEHKQQIIGRDPQVPAATLFDASGGIPLFWQERKTPVLWKRLLSDVKARAVFDLTPGSGALARTCMEEGIAYAAVCQSPIHASWLMNICDRQALRLMCKQRCPLYYQSLATCIQKHFGELLDRLNDQDAAADTDAPDEVLLEVSSG